jgi:pilus assembly protein CpaB
MRNKLVFLLAIVFGLIAAYLVYNYLTQVRVSADNRAYTQVVVATQDIPANTRISSAMVEQKPFPSEFRNNQEITDSKEAVGKITLIAINKGEVVLQNRVIKSGDNKEGLAYVVPEGLRAMSVPVDEVTGVAGLVKKGDQVDIIALVSMGENPPEPRSVLVLQNVEVLNVGTILSPDKSTADKATPAKTITVAVSVEDSLRLKMAIQKGSISLLLRSPVDKGISNAIPFDVNEFNIPAPVPFGRL